MTRDQAIAIVGERDALLRVVDILNGKLVELSGEVVRLHDERVRWLEKLPREITAIDRVKIEPNIFRRGERYQVVWQQDGKQQQKKFETLEEARECRKVMVQAGRIREAA